MSPKPNIMAKKKDIQLEDIVAELTTVTISSDDSPSKDPLVERVLDMRGKGFDNNRIASLLGTKKEIIDSI